MILNLVKVILFGLFLSINLQTNQNQELLGDDGAGLPEEHVIFEVNASKLLVVINHVDMVDLTILSRDGKKLNTSLPDETKRFLVEYTGITSSIQNQDYGELEAKELHLILSEMIGKEVENIISISFPISNRIYCLLKLKDENKATLFKLTLTENLILDTERIFDFSLLNIGNRGLDKLMWRIPLVMVLDKYDKELACNWVDNETLRQLSSQSMEVSEISNNFTYSYDHTSFIYNDCIYASDLYSNEYAIYSLNESIKSLENGTRVYIKRIYYSDDNMGLIYSRFNKKINKVIRSNNYRFDLIPIGN